MLKYPVCDFIWKENIKYPSQNEMLPPKGMEHFLAHDGQEDILPFLLDVAVTVHKGRIYVAWYNSTDAEICGTSLIRGRYSDDEGKNWSEPFVIAGSFEAQGHHYVPITFFPVGDQLYALITQMSGKNITTALDLYRMDENDSTRWSKVSQIAGGFITNAPPQRLDNGNWVVGGWTPMKNDTPAFPVVLISQGDEIEKEWRCVFLYDPIAPNAVRIRCSEISFHADGPELTAYIRNDEGPSYVFESKTYGETWSEPMFNPMTMTGAKIFAGKLSNGKRYLIYNEERGYFIRTLLVIAVADAGERAFNRVYRLFDKVDPEIGRGSTWLYPCSCEYNGYLYIGCTLQEPDNVRSAAIAKIPIDSL